MEGTSRVALTLTWLSIESSCLCMTSRRFIKKNACSCNSEIIKISFFFWVIRREKGTYYALDLGGTYLMVLRVQLGGHRPSILAHDVERHPIPEHLLTSKSEVTESIW